VGLLHDGKKSIEEKVIIYRSREFRIGAGEL
jgi:hypothetical protein